MSRYIFTLIAACAPFGMSAQVVIQHFGAIDPETEGFTRSAGGDVQIGPVFEDLGYDSWKIHSRTHQEFASYFSRLHALEEQAALEYGWSVSSRVRFVELTNYTTVNWEFTVGGVRFRVAVDATEGNGIVVRGDGIDPFSFDGVPTAYHDYLLAYDAVSETAALWINGVQQVTGILGFQSTVPATIHFGATGESITYAHWHEFTLAIVPEPATLSLLAGIGVLVMAGAVRWRRRGRRGGTAEFR
jgi:hypothetical protein